MQPNHRARRRAFDSVLFFALGALTQACVDGTPEIPCQSDDNCPEQYLCGPTGTCLEEKDAVRVSLTLTRSGRGSGTLNTSDGAITCADRCEKTYLKGTTITLTAAEGAFSRFTSWSGSCSGVASTCTLTLSEDTAVGGSFEPVEYPLMVERGGTGQGTVTSDRGGIVCGTQCVASFERGGQVTLTAAAGTVSSFAGWSGACSGVAPTCVVTMDAVKMVRASFDERRATLTVTPSGNGLGTVTSNPPGITCPGTCSAAFAEGTEVTLTASPDGPTSSSFTSWSGACNGQTGPCRVEVDAATQVGVRFDRPPVELTVVTSGRGRVRSSNGQIDCGEKCIALVEYGAPFTLRADPGPAFRATWSDASCGTADTCTLTLTAPLEVRADFAIPLQWGAVVDSDFVPSLVEAGSSLYLSATITSSAGYGNLYVGKYPALGSPANTTPEWVKTFGGGLDDASIDAVVDPSGNIHVLGLFTGLGISFGDNVSRLSSVGGRDGFVAKYDPDGRLLWVTRFGGPGDDRPWAMALKSDGGVVVVGEFSRSFSVGTNTRTVLTSAGGSDGFVLALDSAGARDWAYSIGGPADDQSYDVAVDALDGVYVTGGFRVEATLGGRLVPVEGDRTGYLAVYDASGRSLGSATLGTDTMGFSVAVDPTELLGEVIVGAGKILAGFTDVDVLVTRHSNTGTLLNQNLFGGLSDDYVSAVEVDASGAPLLTGWFSGSIGFGAGITLSSNGLEDAFVAKLEPDLDVDWAEGFGGASSDAGYGLRPLSAHAMMVTGSFVDTFSYRQTTFGTNTPVGSFILRLGLTGDRCEDAIPLQVPASGYGVIVEDFDTSAYANDLEASCVYMGHESGADIVYRLALDQRTRVTFETLGRDGLTLDTVLEFAKDACGERPEETHCNDDAPGIVGSIIAPDAPLEPGIYYINVDSYGRASYPTGRGRLTVTLSAP